MSSVSWSRRIGRVPVAVTSASPVVGGAEDFRRAARALAAEGAQLIWMTGVGFEDEYRYVVAEETGVPVILARPLLGRVLAEVVATAGTPVAALA
jgi:protein AroM